MHVKLFSSILSHFFEVFIIQAQGISLHKEVQGTNHDYIQYIEFEGSLIFNSFTSWAQGPVKETTVKVQVFTSSKVFSGARASKKFDRL